jgi:hypothetical protein
VPSLAFEHVAERIADQLAAVLAGLAPAIMRHDVELPGLVFGQTGAAREQELSPSRDAGGLTAGRSGQDLAREHQAGRRFNLQGEIRCNEARLLDPMLAARESSMQFLNQEGLGTAFAQQ